MGSSKFDEWASLPIYRPGEGRVTRQSLVASPNVGTKDHIWAVGIGFDSLLTTEQTVTLHYDGSSWTQVPSVGAGTSDALYGVSAVPGMEMAVGAS